jgi:hypothetical protein
LGYNTQKTKLLVESRQEGKKIMIKRVEHVSVLQLAKVLAAVYAILAIPVALLALWGLAVGTSHSHELSPWIFVFVPIIYGVAVFIFGLCTALVYNLVAKWIGGIEVTLDD